jgi:DNA-directed RNA polymerase sigma subunit (sigma70/sigma32)
VRQLPDPLFRAYFVRAIEEAVTDPVDRAVMLARYALLDPARGEPATLQQLADGYSVSRERIKQRLSRTWNRMRTKATHQARKAPPPSDPACLWLMHHLV